MVLMGVRRVLRKLARLPKLKSRRNHCGLGVPPQGVVHTAHLIADLRRWKIHLATAGCAGATMRGDTTKGITDAPHRVHTMSELI